MAAETRSRQRPRDAGGEAARERRGRPPTGREAAALPLSHPGVGAAHLLALAALIASVSTRIFDPDMWQHLAVGRAIWTLHRVPTTQLWVWPLRGQPDVNYAWGFEALLWPFWSLGGVAGLFTWRLLTTVAAFACVWLAARRMGARGVAPALVVTLGALVHRERAFLRPESLADVLLALELLALERWRHAERGRGWAVVAIQWAWANVHLSWPLGFLLLGAYELDARLGGSRGRRTLLPVIGAALAVSLLNPFGVRAVMEPFRYAFVQRHSALYRMIDELQPLTLRDLARTWAPLLLLGWPALLVARARRAGLDRVEVALCIAFTAMAATGVRFLGAYSLVATAFLSRDLDTAFRGRRWPAWIAAPGARAALGCAGVLIVAGLGIVRPALAGGWAPFGFAVEWERLPVRACDFMEAHAVRGRGFNAFPLGGWLLFRFWPDTTRLPFLDIHQAGTEQDLSDYLAMMRDPAAWRALDGRRGFQWAMTQTPVEADAVDADSSFVPVFREDAAVLYVKRDGPLAPVAERFGYRVLPGGNRALEALGARAASDPGYARQMEAEARRAAGESPGNGNALSLLSTLEAMAGRTDAARQDLERAVRRLPGLPFGQERLGLLAMRAGRPAEALDHYARERRRSGPSARLALEMGAAWAALGERARAASWYRRALGMDPGYGPAQDSLAALGGRDGH